MTREGAELLEDPLFQASRLRVRGWSAAAAAKELKMSVQELDRAILTERPRYRQFVRTAQSEMFQELGWECMHILKMLLREENANLRLKASETYMRFWNGIIRHRPKKLRGADPFEIAPDDDMTPEQTLQLFKDTVYILERQKRLDNGEPDQPGDSPPDGPGGDGPGGEPPHRPAGPATDAGGDAAGPQQSDAGDAADDPRPQPAPAQTGMSEASVRNFQTPKRTADRPIERRHLGHAGEAASGRERQATEQEVESLPHRFHGIRARTMPIPQVSVIPQKTKPAPTKVDTPRKAGWTNPAQNRTE